MNNSEKDRIAKKSIQGSLENKDRAFVRFYSKWCGFSRRFLPVFEEFSRDNPNECLAFTLDDDPEVCKEYSINYYPTVILFNRGKMQKRLDSKPGIGLNKEQLKDFAEN